MRHTRKNAIYLLMATAAILACVPTFASAPTAIPTFDPNSINTAIVETMNAAATQTSLFITPTETPTSTLTPTKMPTETPVPTNTFVFLLYSPTASKTITPTTAPKTDYACALISQSPEDNSLIGRGMSFSMRWQVKNIGKLFWDSNNADYRYKTGTKMHQQPAYDLGRDIPTGQTADIVVEMTAPTDAGEYSTTWVIRTGKKEFCRLTLKINVN